MGMPSWLAVTLTLCLFADADVPMVYRLRARTAPEPDFPSGDEIRVLPLFLPADEQAQKAAEAQTKAANGTLRAESRLTLVRYVSGEFAHALKPLPAGKEGFLVHAGLPINQQILDRAVATHGAAIHTGDTVQITKLEFRDHAIVVDINGGGRGKHHWRDHLQIGMAGAPFPTTTTTTTPTNPGPPGIQPGAGSTVYLEFNKAVPDLSPADLKQLLSPLLDFAKQRSASVQWYDTLPPEMKKAIQERRAVVGMDREMVVAAIGRPERKVRERDANGNDIEDWIYGQPPSKTMFVRFMGDRVTRIQQFPQ